MSSCEHIMTAFDHKEADRVPITEFGVNPNVWKALGADIIDDTDDYAFNTIPAGAKPEKVQMMIDATRKFGKYPLSL